jgi:pimeloyl-ACP methyl ester carboxylesterase
MKFRQTLIAAALLATSTLAQAGVVKDHPGHWLGELKVPGGPTLEIGAEIFARADGSAWASISVPTQDAYDVPVNTITESGDTATLEITGVTMKLTWARDHFEGEFKQGPELIPLQLREVAQFPVKARRQDPHGPFPYKDETLAIHSADGVTLGATLSIPDNQPHPNVVILVQGSGPGTRHEQLAGHRPFDVLADYLARRGIAVLRYDKRGVSRSTGNYEQHTEADLEDDVYAAVQALRGRKQFGRIGLIGHSEGSQISAAVAARHPESVDFVVSLAGIGLSGIDAIALQDRAQAMDNGANPAELARIMPYVHRYYETLVANADVEPRIAALKALYQGLAPDDQAMIIKYRMNKGTLSLAWAAKPFLRVLLSSDPRNDWRAVHCPVLALNGSLDHQVIAPDNLAGIVGALHSGGNMKVQSAEIPSLNHLFQTAATGAEDEYAKIEETMAPVVLERVATFAGSQR